MTMKWNIMNIKRAICALSLVASSATAYTDTQRLNTVTEDVNHACFVMNLFDQTLFGKWQPRRLIEKELNYAESYKFLEKNLHEIKKNIATIEAEIKTQNRKPNQAVVKALDIMNKIYNMLTDVHSVLAHNENHKPEYLDFCKTFNSTFNKLFSAKFARTVEKQLSELHALLIKEGAGEAASEIDYTIQYVREMITRNLLIG